MPVPDLATNAPANAPAPGPRSPARRGVFPRGRPAAILLGVLLSVLLAAPIAPAAVQSETDVCVYGGTSGGVIAAISAARLGKSVALVQENTHLGGMTSSGLGVTDVGQVGSIRGFADEFYRKVGLRYATSQPVYWFEPKVAEAVFRQMLSEAGVIVHTNERLARVTLSSNRVVALHSESGSRFRARMFIDTTYEGDLLAAAGVRFTVGREGTNTYGESLAGVRPASASYGYDPHVVPGSPDSGLLPLVQPDDLAAPGSGDSRVQAYNFRLCLTQTASNRIPVTTTPPPGYDASRYELVARYLDARLAADGAVSLGQLLHLQLLIPNGKTDVNANGELSSDFVGASHTWATNTPAGRAALRQEHENYLRGLLYFLGNSPRVPASVRTEMQSWGLARDEFGAHQNWPPQLYVREARRMISDVVMRQQHCEGGETAPDPIALASYAMDSHAVHRIARDGRAQTEGGFFVPVSQPFPISYRALVPRADECANLFATFALSASHVAFASCRMEPVFMMTSQAAGTAAAFAIDDGVAVQEVPYARLAAQLRADGQLLDWSGGPLTTNGLILDNGNPGVAQSGSWTTGANPGFWGSSYLHDQNAGKGSKFVRFTPDLPFAGNYDVFTWHVAAGNRSIAVPHDITHANGTTRVLVDQTINGSQWVFLLRTNFAAGRAGGVTIRNSSTTGFVIADAIRFLPAEPFTAPKPVVEVIVSDPNAAETGPDRGRFTFVRRGDLSSRLSIRYALSGPAALNTDFTIPGNVTNLSFGSLAAGRTLDLLPAADALAEPDETVTVTLLPSTDYDLGPMTNATVRLRDGNTLPPRIQDVWHLDGGKVIVEFEAAADRPYWLESSPTLIPSTWSPAGSFPPEPFPRILRVTNSPPHGTPELYFRLGTP